jgi:hypothetical protein
VSLFCKKITPRLTGLSVRALLQPKPLPDLLSTNQDTANRRTLDTFVRFVISPLGLSKS